MTFYIPKKALLMCASVLKPQQVFATSTYTGNGGTQTITNGLDLAGKGGLVWGKSRNNTFSHSLVDSVRGRAFALSSNVANAETSGGPSNDITAFNSNGFTLGPNSATGMNVSGSSDVAWSFRRAKKFFDIVTYTGNGQSGRQIPHGLGDVPGMMIFKRRDSTENWFVYHRANTSPNANWWTNLLQLNLTGGSAADATPPGQPTATNLVVNADYLNVSGKQYVAYLFAHNPDLIDCGSYVGNGNANGPSVTCGKGWNPQFLLIKNTAASASYSYWMMLDTARTPGLSGADEILRANTSESQLTLINVADLTGTGFKLATNDPAANQSNSTFVFMAIRAPT